MNRNQPILSTSSLAIASLIVASFAFICGLSPLLMPAFLSVAALGMVLAVLSVISYRDHSSMQVGALAINAAILVLALLRGPIGTPQTAIAAETISWDPISSVDHPCEYLSGVVMTRHVQRHENGLFMDLVIQWDVSTIQGCWNWFEGTLVVKHAGETEDRSFDWRIDGPIHQSSVVMNGRQVRIDADESDCQWLTSARYENLEIQFHPVRWEHSALKQRNGILVPITNRNAEASTGTIW